MPIVARRFLFWWVGRKRAPDLVVVIHWFPDGPAAARWAARLGVPLVVNIIGGRAELVDGGRRISLSSLPQLAKKLLQVYETWWLNKSAVITVTGEATRRWYREAGVNAPALLTLHAAIDCKVAGALSSERDVDVAFVGRADPDKRIDRFFNVLARMAESLPGLRASVVGVLESNVIAITAYRAAKSVLGERLALLGRVPEVEVVLSRAKVLLITSDTEGRTLAALEAFACGAAVVATAVGDLEEAIAGSGGGVTVPLDDNEERVTQALADATMSMLASEPQRAASAARGREFVLRSHSPSRAKAEWGKILNIACEPAPHR